MDNKLPHQFEKLMFQSNAMQTKAQGSNQYLGKAKVAFLTGSPKNIIDLLFCGL